MFGLGTPRQWAKALLLKYDGAWNCARPGSERGMA